jgi:pimeloyl-ACP methyl ester carboxylesterase
MPIALIAAVMVLLAMVEIPATHYVKSDDVHIAYQVLGEGSFDLLFVPGFVSNIEAAWQSPAQSAFFRRLASFCRLILFEKRGTGMSDRGSQIFTLEQRMHDVQAVLDEVGSQRLKLRQKTYNFKKESALIGKTK